MRKSPNNGGARLSAIFSRRPTQHSGNTGKKKNALNMRFQAWSGGAYATSAGIGVSGKLVFHSMTPTSPT
jgi:hypothetical protein